ncbi:MAG TPA: HNH endonuclease signature motif containing protein, partial [Anaeromyxobacter sp.]
MTNAQELTRRLQDLLARERVAMADFLVAVADFDRRALWLELGYASLFEYLNRELGLSKASTFLRVRAVGLIQRFPDVLEALRDGRLCISSMGELSKVLTQETKDEVLPRFFHLSKREAKAVAAELRPDEAPPRRDVVTTLRAAVEVPRLELAAPKEVPAPAREASFSLCVVRPGEPDPSDAPLAPVPPRSAPSAAPPAGPPPSTIEPLTAELIRIHLTADKRFEKKLEQARDALSHSLPTGSIAEILEAGLDLVIARHAKRRGLVEKPRATPPPSSPDPGYVPAHVKRAVWKRDGGRCQFPLASGGVCGSTRRCQIDHIVPRALGGASTVENCRVCCDRHNDRAAREVFGDAWMDRFTANPRAGAPPAGERRRAGPAPP